MITLKFIWHDCFVLETPAFAAVFDFWKDGRRSAASGEPPAFLSSIPEDKPLYVLVSHHHKDHFHRSIFNWEQVHPEIRFIISKDTERAARFMFREKTVYNGFKPSTEKVTVLRPGESFSDSLLTVDAFGSTDTGNSYLLTDANGMTAFHAGDLNAWIWKDESSEKEIEEAENAYLSIVKKIAERSSSIDFAMFPVDSRIGTDYWTGAYHFVRIIDVARFFPMHFCLADDEDQLRQRMADACLFPVYANHSRGEYITLQHPYSSFASSRP